MDDKRELPSGQSGSLQGMPLVYVVVPVFNRLSFTRVCLDGLREQTYRALQVIVVDGGSTDDTVEAVKREYPEATVLHGRGELWWGGAMQWGIEHALERSNGDKDFVLMMNNDTEILPSYIETLVRVSLTERAAVGSTVVDSRDRSRVLDAGEFIDWRTYSFSVRTQVEPNRLFFDEIDLLPGRGTLVPIRMIRIAGNVDGEAFPHYAGDYEFFHRLKRCGFRLGVTSEATIAAHAEETGLYTVGGNIGIRRAWSLVSSRKSMNNVVDHWRFISRCAPDGRKNGARARMVWRSLQIFFFQTWLRYPVRPVTAVWRWLRFFAVDHYYVTDSDCSRLGLDPSRLAERKILLPWLRTDWYKFSQGVEGKWEEEPQLRRLYRCAWNPSTKIQRWIRARAYREELRKAA